MDNFKENFTFNECNGTEFYKCDIDGKCYENFFGISCQSNNKTFVGYWNPIYPSQDYWK